MVKGFGKDLAILAGFTALVAILSTVVVVTAPADDQGDEDEF